MGRSSNQTCSIKKDALKNFATFIKKHLYASLFFNKVKKETPKHMFSCEFCEIFNSTYFQEHLRKAASQ